MDGQSKSIHSSSGKINCSRDREVHLSYAARPLEPAGGSGGVLVLTGSPFAYCGRWIITTENRRWVVSTVPRHREEHDQDSKNKPDVEAHREEPLARGTQENGDTCQSANGVPARLGVFLRAAPVMGLHRGRYYEKTS
jgi:hypothetical protein